MKQGNHCNYEWNLATTFFNNRSHMWLATPPDAIIGLQNQQILEAVIYQSTFIHFTAANINIITPGIAPGRILLFHGLRYVRM